MRRVAVVTGTRAEYGLLEPVMEEIKRSKTLRLQLVVTGMHLSKIHGYTATEIERDGFEIDERVDPDYSGDTVASMAESLGSMIIGVTKALERLDPDIVLVLGDRSEALAGAIAGAFTNRVVAHIHGGEVSKGSIDESIRHAVTKFAHIHFPATEESAERIIKLGERPENVHIVGAPGLDVVLNLKALDPNLLAKKYSLDPKKPLILALQHPVTQQETEAARQMEITLEALRELVEQTILIYPNNDAGGLQMIKAINEAELPNFIKAYPSIPRGDFLGLMRMATVMMGNSSSGIIEAPSFGLPVVNIGIRQDGRQRAGNVIDVGHNKDEIVKVTRFTIENKEFREKITGCVNPYGDGKSSKRIVKILASVKIDANLIEKQITY